MPTKYTVSQALELPAEQWPVDGMFYVHVTDGTPGPEGVTPNVVHGVYTSPVTIQPTEGQRVIVASVNLIREFLSYNSVEGPLHTHIVGEDAAPGDSEQPQEQGGEV